MFAPVRFGAVAALAVFLTCGAIRAQTTAEKLQRDYSTDPCSDPKRESQYWFVMSGKVSKVVDGRTVLLSVPEAPHLIRLRIAGIRTERRDKFSEKARAHLRLKLLGKAVEVAAKTHDFLEHSRDMTAVLYLPTDIGHEMLGLGLVRFEEPPPYTMSGYGKCQYRQAEADAHSKRLGLWQHM